MNITHSTNQERCAACMISSCIRQANAWTRQFSCWLARDGHNLSPIFPRLLLAYEFGEAGLEKLRGNNWFSDLAFPFPINLLSADVNWALATGLEIIAPVALVLGFMTRFFSAALMILTIVAIAAVHWPAEWYTLAELWKGYVITDQGYGNYKLPLIYLIMLGSLLLSGSGRWGVDAWLRHRTPSLEANNQ
ncbi:MAG: HvfX family Cu-binding RiPP maturation protein [Methylobacter sp.]